MEVIVAARDQADLAFVRSFLQGVVAFRWLTIGWAAVGVVISDEHLVHRTAAWLLVAAAVLFTATTTALVRQAPDKLLHPLAILVEFAIGAALLIADGWVYADTRPQSLPWAWPAGSIISGAIAFGVQAGLFLAVALGIASFVGEGLNAGGANEWGVAASSKLALYVLAAAVAGYVTRRLRQAEEQVSVARAREEVARTLHDGVLQTLAVVQRRSDDQELADLAREQDRELRHFLFGTGVDDKPLSAALHDAASRTERSFGLATQIVVADDLPDLTPAKVRAIGGAVGEALANAGKHARATRVVVYVEPDDSGIFCSIKDDGEGFDPETAHEGQGLRRSVRGRIDDVGGRVEISSRPGRGTEIRLWVD